MPSVHKSDGGVCPKCGGRLTSVSWSFDPFPGESSGLSESQITIGCPECGWQEHQFHNQEYDQYNPNRPELGPRDFDKEMFKLP